MAASYAGPVLTENFGLTDLPVLVFPQPLPLETLYLAPQGDSSAGAGAAAATQSGVRIVPGNTQIGQGDRVRIRLSAQSSISPLSWPNLRSAILSSFAAPVRGIDAVGYVPPNSLNVTEVEVDIEFNGAARQQIGYLFPGIEYYGGLGFNVITYTLVPPGEAFPPNHGTIKEAIPDVPDLPDGSSLKEYGIIAGAILAIIFLIMLFRR